MATLDAPETARLLTELSRRTELAGGNPYRARAYAKAAESLAALPIPLARVIAEGRLRDIPGVGETIAEIVTKLHHTGTHPTLEQLRSEVPAGVLDMLTIPGLRPDKVLRIYRELGIATIADLEAAARADRLKSVKGIGLALQRKILDGLALSREQADGRHLHRAEAILQGAADQLLRSDLGVEEVLPAGDFRRGMEVVADLAVVGVLPRLNGEPRELQRGELSIHLTDRERLGVTLLLATGSSEHLAKLAAHAQRRKLDLGVDGLARRGRMIASRTEKDIYQALGLQFIPPELREGNDEIALAEANAIPRLVEQGDLRGILHAHTNASDGGNTLIEMAEAARERGYRYFGVADHSKSAHYAGGLSVDEIERQHEEIDRLNAGYGNSFRIFKGIESDILADGSLDYDDEVLRRFDFVVASVHSQFRMEPEAQTERIVRAVANPFTTILGHMTGRQLLRRRGYDVDIEKIIAACAAHGVVIELNANPWRLDLDWRWHRRALAAGCMFSVNPDAHSTAEIDLVRWGVLQARKGGLAKTDVLNCLSRPRFATFLKKRKAATA